MYGCEPGENRERRQPCQADLGGDRDLIAERTLRQRLADDLLGAAEALGRRCRAYIDDSAMNTPPVSQA